MMIRSARRLFASYAPPRNTLFATLTDADVQTFESIVSSKGVFREEGDIAAHNVDWTKKFQGASKLVLKPSSTEEVSAILKHCNSRKLAVVP